MNHTLFSGSELNKCTKLFYADYLTCEGLTFFEVSNNDIYHIDCLLKLLLVFSAYRNLTVIGNIDLNACTSDDLVDCLSSLSDNITDLLGIDLNRYDLGSILGYFLTRLSNSLAHTLVHDEESCLAALLDSCLNDRLCKTVNLDIHLDSCDTVFCTCYLEVHISEEIFKSLNICKYDEIIVCIACYKTTAYTCNHLLDRNTCSHK